ncbi:NAD(P)-binding protein [Hypoxylon crocopeplum]|nr:NAD(P)-binding protein [Hypoxylon crocopeplum]
MSQHLESRAAFEASLFGFLYRQWIMHRKPIPKETRLSGQTAIVTGSNSGLGFEAARQLLQLGVANIIMAVRSQTRGDAAASKLRREFPGSTVSVWLLDMESYDSITAFAKRCETLPRLDIAILNAGLRSDSFKLVESTHHEQSFQVNYLSTALLTILLLPIMKSKKSSPPVTQPPRLSLVSSDTSYWGTLRTGPIVAQCDDPAKFDPMGAYSRSKLLQVLFVSKLAERVNSDNVIVNASNPGLCKGTEFGSDATGSPFVRLAFRLFQSLNGRTVEAGASALVDAVITGKEGHGSYVSDWTIQPYPKLLYTKEGRDVGDRVWEETMEELNFVGASKIVQKLKQ